jgi:IclR family transcriptional regulator, acetate operon repressor
VSSQIQSIDRAAMILELILSSDQAPTFSDVTDSTGLPKSTASRLLASLEANNLIAKNEDNNYVAGATITRFSHSSGPEEDLIARSHASMELLSQETGEAINLAVLVGDEVQQIAQIDSKYLMGNVNWVGLSVPTHCSAVGKSFLAFGSAETSGRLSKRTSKSITTKSALHLDLKAVRKRGWALSESELEVGLTAIGAPIFNADGTVVAALSVSGPTMRLTSERVEAIGELISQQGLLISEQLGFGVPETTHREYSTSERKVGAA